MAFKLFIAAAARKRFSLLLIVRSSDAERESQNVPRPSTAALRTNRSGSFVARFMRSGTPCRMRFSPISQQMRTLASGSGCASAPISFSSYARWSSVKSASQPGQTLSFEFTSRQQWVQYAIMSQNPEAHERHYASAETSCSNRLSRSIVNCTAGVPSSLTLRARSSACSAMRLISCSSLRISTSRRSRLS